MQDAEYIPAGVKILQRQMPARYAFSICTLMTRPDQYVAMLQSYRDAGFGVDCEFLCIDNSRGNIFDAYAGYNAFLVEAKGEYIILTHQDVLLCFDDRLILEQRLQALNELDETWGVCGNAGGVAMGKVAIRISDPHGENTAIGVFPQKVLSLDENFMIAKRTANLCLSGNLSGYHMYGSDICTMADIKGNSCYVIDFHLRHLSGGTEDDSFKKSVAAFALKYAKAFRSRWIQTSVTTVFLSGQNLCRFVATSKIGRKLGIATK